MIVVMRMVFVVLVLRMRCIFGCIGHRGFLTGFVF